MRDDRVGGRFTCARLELPEATQRALQSPCPLLSTAPSHDSERCSD